MLSLAIFLLTSHNLEAEILVSSSAVFKQLEPVDQVKFLTVQLTIFHTCPFSHNLMTDLFSPPQDYQHYYYLAYDCVIVNKSIS